MPYIKISPISVRPGPTSAPPFSSSLPSSDKAKIVQLEADLSLARDNLMRARQAAMDANMRATRSRLTLEELNGKGVPKGLPNQDMMDVHPMREQLLNHGFKERTFFMPRSPSEPTTSNNTVEDDTDDDEDDPLHVSALLDTMHDWVTEVVETVTRTAEAKYRRNATNKPKRAGRARHFFN